MDCGVRFLKVRNQLRCQPCVDKNKAKIQEVRGLAPRACRVCGKAITQRDMRVFCSSTCKAIDRRAYDRSVQKKYREKRHQAVQVICDVCGTSFTARNRTYKRCSKRCRAAAHCLEVQRRHDKQNHNAVEERHCARCDRKFLVRKTNGHKKYCSSHCSSRALPNSHRRRARYYGVNYESINPITVFNRDGWRCQVCGVRTPKKARGTYQQNAPELDHRIPMVLGGSHTWDNVQCACRSCNAEKGGTKVIGQLHLFPEPVETRIRLKEIVAREVAA